MAVTEVTTAPHHRFPQDIRDHETHGRLRIGAEGEITPGKRLPPFAVRREDDYPVEYKGGGMRRTPFGDGSFSIDCDDRWDMSGKWTRITTTTFTDLLADARKVMRAGRIYVMPQATIVFVDENDGHRSVTRNLNFGPAWEVRFDRKEVRYSQRSALSEADRRTVIFETPEAFGAWATDLDTHGGMWQARIDLQVVHAAALHDAIADAEQRIAMRAAGIPAR